MELLVLTLGDRIVLGQNFSFFLSSWANLVDSLAQRPDVLVVEPLGLRYFWSQIREVWQENSLEKSVSDTTLREVANEALGDVVKSVDQLSVLDAFVLSLPVRRSQDFASIILFQERVGDFEQI